MTYIDDIAAQVRAHVPDQMLPDGDTTLLFQLYAVLLLAKGSEVTASDVHNAWSVWMQSTRPDHPALQPFDELDADTRKGDAPYVDAIRQAATSLAREQSS